MQNKDEQIIHIENDETDVVPQKVSFKLSLLGIGLAVLFATAAFFSGLQIGSIPNMQASISSIFADTSKTDDSVDFTEFWRVWNMLDEKFVSSTTTDPLTKEERMWGAISGLVDSYGDPYTVFLPPEDASMFEEDISGNFSGVGMEVGIRDGVVTIISPLPNTPAENAGLLAGDMIVRIDDKSTDRMRIDEAVRLIRGERGTEVVLTIYREGSDELTDISVIRDTINIPTSKTEIRDGVFIISLYSFNGVAEREVQMALREYVESGKTKLILDLRGNPGGYLQGAVSIASYFLPTGKVVVRESFGDNEEEEVYRSFGKELGRFAPESIVVLVDGGSASASEILAGALKDHGVATIIGTKTFGKGSVQELINLSDGSSVKITIARWLTPNGTSFSGGGLMPDIEIERTPEDRTNNIDPQLDEAINYLNRNK